MTKCRSTKGSGRIGARCDCDRSSFPIAISDISPDGCSVLAPDEWAEDFDFLRLTIADHIEINGRVLRHKGRRATIGFFGQIHPLAIKALGQMAA